MFLVVAAALLALLVFANPLASGLWQKTLFDSMHVLVFAVVALALRFAIVVFAGINTTHSTIIAGLMAFALSIFSEAIQIPGPRDASVHDLLADWLGAIAALLFATTLSAEMRVRRTGRITIAAIATALLFIALWPLLTVSIAYTERYTQLPTLVSFDSRFGHVFHRPSHSSIETIRDSINERNVGEITLEDGKWPGIIFQGIWPDWREFSTLVLEFGLDDESPLNVNIRVHDLSHKFGSQPRDDRFDTTFTLQPGFGTLMIPLEQIRNAPIDRLMDMSEIDAIIIFCSREDIGRVFQLADIRLQ